MLRAELMRIKMKFMFHVIYNEVKKKNTIPYIKLYLQPQHFMQCAKLMFKMPVLPIKTKKKKHGI